MKCSFCHKHIDEVDCSCKMCTTCGWTLDAVEIKSAGNAEKKASLRVVGFSCCRV